MSDSEMILWTATDPIYFDIYFDMWIEQMDKFYPELKRYLSIYRPTNAMVKKCRQSNVECMESKISYINHPERKHFLLMRWLDIPHELVVDYVLAPQITCMPIKKQEFDLKVLASVDHVRLCYLNLCSRRRLGLVGVSVSVFSKYGARKTVEYATILLKDIPIHGRDMNIWQYKNLKYVEMLAEVRVGDPMDGLDINNIDNIFLKDNKDAYWVTGISKIGSVDHAAKLKVLKHFIAETNDS